MRFTCFCRRNKWFLNEIIGCTWQHERYVKTTHSYGLICSILTCNTQPHRNYVRVSNGNKMYCSMLHLLSHWQCYTQESGLLHSFVGVSLGLHARVIGDSAGYTDTWLLRHISHHIHHLLRHRISAYVMRSHDDVMRSKGCGDLLIDLRFFLLLALRSRFHLHCWKAKKKMVISVCGLNQCKKNIANRKK